MATTDQYDPLMIQRHCDLMLPDGGSVVLLTKKPNAKGFEGRRYNFPDEIYEITELAESAAAAASPVYYVPALVKPTWDTGTTPRKEHIAGSNFAILDFDAELFVPPERSEDGDEIAGLAAEHYVRERERTLTLPAELPPATIKVSTGGGAQFLWATDRTFSPDQFEAVNIAILRVLTERTGRQPKDTACWNCNRILRLAGTWNPKSNDYRIPRMAELVL